MLTGLNHITLVVSDLENSLFFYVDVLGFDAHVKWDKGAYLSLPDLWLCLSLDTPKPSQDYSHLALNVEQAQFGAFAQKLKDADVKRWKENTSEGDSLYILDPDNHKLEIHSGSLHSRLESLKSKPYKGLQWL